MPVGCYDIKWHPLDPDLEELRCPDMRNAPEPHLAGAHGDGRIDLAVHRDDLVLLAEREVLDEKKPLGQPLH